jgi:hypothetical protein
VYVGPTTEPEIISPVAGEMAIFVKLPTEETATFYVSTDGTVKDLMDKINERVGIPAEQLFIIFGCKQLNDPDRKLRDYSIQPESTVYVLLRLRGGAINAYFTNDLDPDCGTTTSRTSQIKQSLSAEVASTSDRVAGNDTLLRFSISTATMTG